MVAISEMERENREGLFALMRTHPDLPVVPMVECDVVSDDSYGWWLGEWGRSEVTAFYQGREHIHFKTDDEEDVLADMVGCGYYETEDGRDITELSEKEWVDLFGSLPWVDCIAVCITA